MNLDIPNKIVKCSYSYLKTFENESICIPSYSCTDYRTGKQLENLLTNYTIRCKIEVEMKNEEEEE